MEVALVALKFKIFGLDGMCSLSEYSASTRHHAEFVGSNDNSNTYTSQTRALVGYSDNLFRRILLESSRHQYLLGRLA